jgi:hypothetical protein
MHLPAPDPRARPVRTFQPGHKTSSLIYKSRCPIETHRTFSISFSDRSVPFRAVAAPDGRLGDLAKLQQLLLVGWSSGYTVFWFSRQHMTDIARVCEQKLSLHTLHESKFCTLMNQSPFCICFRWIVAVSSLRRRLTVWDSLWWMPTRVVCGKSSTEKLQSPQLSWADQINQSSHYFWLKKTTHLEGRKQSITKVPLRTLWACRERICVDLQWRLTTEHFTENARVFWEEIE